MISIVKKAFVLFLVCLLIFSNVRFSRPAYAAGVGNPVLDAPGGQAIAASYIIGGLLVSAGAAAVSAGSQAQDFLKQKAIAVFNSLDAAKKQLWFDAIKASYNGSIATVHITDDMVNSLHDKLVDMALASQSTDYYVESGNQFKFYRSESFFSFDSNVGYHFIAGGVTGNNIVIQFWHNSSLNTYGGSASISQIVNGNTVTSKTFADVSFDRATFDLLSKVPVNLGYLALSYSSLVGAFALAADNSTVPVLDYFSDSVNRALDSISNGLREVNIPLDQFLTKAPTGDQLKINTDGSLANADGSAYTGTNTWDFPIPVPDALTVPGVSVSNPAVPLDKVVIGDTPFIKTDTVTDTPGPTPDPTPDPDVPPASWNPFVWLLPFLDFLLACINYVVKLGAYVLKIPGVPEKPIPAPYGSIFTFFKSIQYGNIKPYDLMITVASTLFGFGIFRILRKVWNSAG